MPQVVTDNFNPSREMRSVANPDFLLELGCLEASSCEGREPTELHAFARSRGTIRAGFESAFLNAAFDWTLRSLLSPRMVCIVCGAIGADVRPN